MYVVSRLCPKAYFRCGNFLKTATRMIGRPTRLEGTEGDLHSPNKGDKVRATLVDS